MNEEKREQPTMQITESLKREQDNLVDMAELILQVSGETARTRAERLLIIRAILRADRRLP